jgi:hypothetical protein
MKLTRFACETRTLRDPLHAPATSRQLAAWAWIIGVPLAVASAVSITAATACPAQSGAASGRPVQRQAAIETFLAQRHATGYGRFAPLTDDGEASAALSR